MGKRNRQRKKPFQEKPAQQQTQQTPHPSNSEQQAKEDGTKIATALAEALSKEVAPEVAPAVSGEALASKPADTDTSKTVKTEEKKAGTTAPKASKKKATAKKKPATKKATAKKKPVAKNPEVVKPSTVEDEGEEDVTPHFKQTGHGKIVGIPLDPKTVAEWLAVNWADIKEFPDWDVRVPGLDLKLAQLQQQIEADGRVRVALRCLLLGKTLWVYDGFRRKRALRAISKTAARKRVDLKNVPVVVDLAFVEGTKPEHVSSYVFGLKGGCQEKPYSPVEQGILYQRLMDVAGYSVIDIARAFSMRPADVSARLALIAASPKVAGAVTRNDLAISDAVEIVKAPTNKEQDALLAQAQESGIAGRSEVIRRVKLKPTARRTRSQVTPQQARGLLAQVADSFVEFRRADQPAKPYNEAWVSLENLLLKIRRMKVAGKL